MAGAFLNLPNICGDNTNNGENGKIYQNIKEASETYKLSTSSIEGNASGKYMTLKSKWVFCYIDNENKEMLTENHFKGLEIIKNINTIRYVAWYVEDKEMHDIYYFKTIDEICEKLKIKSKSHITNVCKGKRSHAQKWRFAYFNNETKSLCLPICTKKQEELLEKLFV